MPAFCAAIDWGTTNFRLWIVDFSGRVLGERRSDEGLQFCAPDRFEDVMESNLASLGASQDLPVVICGMAGSRDGWKNAPYLQTPARLDDLSTQSVRVNAGRRTVCILPGVSQRDTDRPDVMRGEETQLSGAVAKGFGDGLYCLPGTHSKWARIENGCLTEFYTFLTGELFDLLSRHSILRHTVRDSGPDIATHPAFTEAVRDMAVDPGSLTRRLFSIRAASLFNVAADDDAKARLSGLLIGVETAAAHALFGTEQIISLIADDALGQAYEAAITTTGFQVRLLDGEMLTRGGLHDAAIRLWGDSQLEAGQA